MLQIWQLDRLVFTWFERIKSNWEHFPLDLIPFVTIWEQTLFTSVERAYCVQHPGIFSPHCCVPQIASHRLLYLEAIAFRATKKNCTLLTLCWSWCVCAICLCFAAHIALARGHFVQQVQQVPPLRRGRRTRTFNSANPVHWPGFKLVASIRLIRPGVWSTGVISEAANCFFVGKRRRGDH